MVCLRDVSAQRQHQTQCQVCHVIGQHAGRVRHHDTTPDCGLNINAVIAHTKNRYQLQVGQLLKQRARHQRLPARRQAQNSRGQFGKASSVAFMRAVVHMKHLFEGLEVQRMHLGNCQDFRL